MGQTTETIVVKSKDDSKSGFNSVKKNVSSLDKIAKRASQGVAGIAGGAVLVGLGNLAMKALDSADAIEKLSRRSGGSARFLSEMRFGLSQNDVTLEKFTDSLKDMNKNAVDAAKGTGMQAEAMNVLGVDAKTFLDLNTDEKFITLSEAISKVENPSIRSHAAMALFGESGQQLLTVMENGASGIAKYREEAERMGMSLSQDQVQAAAAANDAIDKLTSSIGGAITQAILPYADSIAKAAEFTGEYLPKAIEFLINIFRGLKLAVQLVMKSIIDNVASFIGLAEKLPLIGEKFQGVGESVRLASDVMQDQITKNMAKISGQEIATGELSATQSTAAEIADRQYIPSLITTGLETEKVKSATEKYADRLKKFEGTLDEVENQTKFTADKIEILKIRIMETGDPTKDLSALLDKLTESANGLADEMSAAERATERYEDQIVSFNDEIEDSKLSTKLLAEKIDLLKDSIQNAGDPTGQLTEKLRELEGQTHNVGNKSSEVATTMRERWTQASSAIGQAMTGFFNEGLSGWDNFKTSIVDIFKNMISEMISAWLVSGIAGLFAGDGFSGFNVDAFTGGGGFGGSGGGGGNNALGGSGNGGQFTAYANTANDAYGVYNGVKQGGTDGYTSAAISGAKIYSTGVNQGWWSSIFNGGEGLSAGNSGFWSGLFGGGSAAASGGISAVGGTLTTIEAANSLGLGIEGLNATLASANETLALTSEVSTITAETATASGGSGGIAAGYTAAAAWIAVGVIADEYLNDGRVSKAFVGEYHDRRDAVGELGRGNFAAFRNAQFQAPYDAVLATFAGRGPKQILMDEMAELFGNQAEGFSAVGADGGLGFKGGGNSGVFGANFGIEGTGVTSQHFVDQAQFFTGAQESLDAIKALADDAGFTTNMDDGALKVLGATEDQMRSMWQTYADGLNESIAHSATFEAAIENHLIHPQNMFIENVSTAFGQSAFEARESIIAIALEYDGMIATGMESTEALFTSISDHYGIATEDAALFVELSGVSIDQWKDNFTNATTQGISDLLEFDAMGITAFESINSSAEIAASGVQTSWSGVGEFGESVFSKFGNSAKLNLANIAAASNDTNAMIQDDFAITMESLIGSWDGLSLGTLAPIEVPAIIVPETVQAAANDSLGNFAKGGSFIVPGSGSTDKQFRIGLTPGERVTIEPNGNALSTPSDSGSSSEVSELKAEVIQLTKTVNKLVGVLDFKKAGRL